MSDDARLEVCPACLLESGLDLLDDEDLAEVNRGSARPNRINAFGPRVEASAHVKESVSPSRTAPPRTILGDFGDYELLEEIGRGGQAVVYRAHQRSLNRTVALKVIGLGPWTSERHLKRFRREAEAAASLEHPSIVPIYEVGERDGQCYFSMQFIEGGQLDEVVTREPIPIRHAAEVVAKVARTVQYAHEHGILHRDIKPGNILLDKNGEPHLTDFGLARLVEGDSTITATLDVLGTPSYMAPEQTSGNSVQLGNATDVYGLGAVLYQLLTGHPPFAGGTTYETIKLLLDTDPRPPRQLNPKIDRELSTICLKCLEKDPTHRYSSALALAEDLEHWLKHEPIQAKRSGVFTRTRKWVRRNPSTSVLVALLVLLGTGLSLTVWNRKPSVVIPKSIAVLPFENLSEDPDNAYFADGIQEEILTRLTGISDLKVISRTSTQRYHSKPANLAEIAKQLGVANILEGSIQKASDQVRVNVQLINAQTDSHLWANSYDRKLTDIFGVESEIAKGITDSLQAKLTGREEQALTLKPTNNPEAYDAYLRGRSFEARNYFSSYSYDLEGKAASSYERAVQLDPKFAFAWGRLSRVDSSIYFNSHDTIGDARGDAAKHALEQAQKLAPNSPETLLAFAYYQGEVLRDFGAAKTAFERVHKLLPNNSEVLSNLSAAARYTGHWDESIPYTEQALALDPRNVEVLMNAALNYAELRQLPAALRLYDRVLDITPNDLDVIAAKASIYQAQGDLPQAAKLLSGINEQTPNTATFNKKINQLQYERNYAEAIRLLQARLTQFHYTSELDKGSNEVALASTQLFAGDTAGAKLTASHALHTYEQRYGEQPNDSFAAMAVSQVYALIGQKDSALKAAERAVMLLPSVKDPVSGPSLEENLVGIQALVGENRRAVATLTELLQTPYLSWLYGPPPVTRALLRLDPEWDSLRVDPAFQKLCEERLDKSIAVLPFENLSGDRNNAYFAEGIQEEILTRLSKIADLKVISRTSTQQYQSKPQDLGEIAKQLGVANVLEGSVQKAADQVRVNVQLINAQTDSHLWADTYDRKLNDFFGVESEIAKRIAESLQAKLTRKEEQALAVRPTNNPEAYDAYLRGLSLEARNYYTSYSADLEGKAIESYERAVQLDPNFAFAWAQLSRAHGLIYYANRFNPSRAARGEASKRALEQAQKLAPDSPETLIALGLYQYDVLGNNADAKATFERVIEMVPGSSDVRVFLGQIAKREGRWDQSIAYIEQALAFDPRNVWALMLAVETHAMLQQFPAALNLLDRALDVTPNDLDIMAIKASIYQAQGRLPEADSLLSGVNDQTPNEQAFAIKMNQLQYERNYGEAIRLLQARLAKFHHASEADKAKIQVSLAYIELLAGDATGARVTAEPGRNTFEQLYRDQRDDPYAAYVLSQTYAVMGQKDSALKEAERAVMLMPSGKEPLLGPGFEENLAAIQALFGENSRAISSLTKLLQMPYGSIFYHPTHVTPALLKLDPLWDSLRGAPDFKKLCEEKQP